MNLVKNVLIIALLGLPLAACDSNDGPVEKLGKDIDKTLDNTRDAVDDAVD